MASTPHQPLASPPAALITAVSVTPPLLTRAGILIALLGVELLVVSLWLDAGDLARKGGLGTFIFRWGAWTLRASVAALAVFITFGYSRLRETLAGEAPAAPSWMWLAGHAVTLGAFCGLSTILFGSLPSGPIVNLVATAWIAIGLGSILCAILCFVPFAIWRAILSATGLLWLVATAAGILAAFAGNLARSLWAPTAELTFALVEGILTSLGADVIAMPEQLAITVGDFGVTIDPQCSGLEGVAMIFVFTSAWLAFFRHEFRFPRALLLIPAGTAVIWLLNLLRISGLILLGAAGARGIALGGFHSQAGWIAFNLVAVGLATAGTKLSWIAAAPRSRATGAASNSENPTAWYLAPFLAILAASLVSRAASDEFEWLYPVRLFAGVAVLWFYRARYREFDWRFGPVSVCTGLAVGALWIAVDRFSGTHATSNTGPTLAAAPALAHYGWLACRLVAHVVTVPIAEELAFRGYAIRRLQSPRFETLDWRSYNWLALAVSSGVFGWMHGDRWIAGVVAGLAFAFALLRRGRIGDAVAAHSSANLVLAVWVLVFEDWGLW